MTLNSNHVGLPDMNHRVCLIFWVAFSATPSVAIAEVMDKEPSLAFLWSIAVGSTLVALVGCRASPWFALLSAPLPLIYGTALFFELIDPSVGPTILKEGDIGYIVGVLAAALLVVVGHVGGMVLWWRHRPTGRSSGHAASGAPLS